MAGTYTRLSSVVRFEMDGRIVFTVCVSLECLGTPILKLVFSHDPGCDVLGDCAV